MDNLKGAALMVAAMAFFAVEDMFVKKLAGVISVGMLLALLGAGGWLVFAAIAKAQGRRLLTRDLLSRPVMLRNLGEMVGTLGFVFAIALTPISSASAILQANPLAVTLLAALFLGAPVGWRRWTAIIVGFLGVLLILRPGLDGFQPASLFAVQGVIGLAVRDVATRACPPTVSSMQLSSYGFLSIVPVGLALLVFHEPSGLPQGDAWFLMGAALVAGVVGYYMIVAAMRIGDVAVVTPFRYTRLIFALMTGYFVFDERPDTLMLVGAGIVVASGVYTLWREAQTARVARRAAASPVRPTA